MWEPEGRAYLRNVFIRLNKKYNLTIIEKDNYEYKKLESTNIHMKRYVPFYESLLGLGDENQRIQNQIKGEKALKSYRKDKDGFYRDGKDFIAYVPRDFRKSDLLKIKLPKLSLIKVITQAGLLPGDVTTGLTYTDENGHPKMTYDGSLVALWPDKQRHTVERLLSKKINSSPKQKERLQRNQNFIYNSNFSEDDIETLQSLVNQGRDVEKEMTTLAKRHGGTKANDISIEDYLDYVEVA